MPTNFGSIDGTDHAGRLTNLAGWLAEQGVTDLTIHAPAGSRHLTARTTDLPAEISAVLKDADGIVRFESPSAGITILLTPDACLWSRAPHKPTPIPADQSNMDFSPQSDTTRPLTIAHVTHEAVVHMGGIGTVLQGLLTSPDYLAAVNRSILIGPLWDTGPVDDVNSRLGGDGAKVLYSSLDNHDPAGFGAKLRPIELAFGVRAVYGTRVFQDAVDPNRHETAEVLLFDLHAADTRRVNEFKAILFERFHIECHPFDHNGDFEQWVRIAQPAYAALVALTEDNQLPGVLISHEYMGMPAALAATLDPAQRFRTLFHGHECTSARHVVEYHPGHDAAFYPEMHRALAAGESIEDVFGSQRNNYRHQLVSRAHHLDGIIAVGDETANELRFLNPQMHEANVRLCYNGAPGPVTSIEDKLASRKRVLDWLEPLLGFRPNHLLTHVTRPVISKGLWRDLAVCEELDKILCAQGEKAAYLLLTCGAQPRTYEDVTKMNAEYGWPAQHRDGYPDAVGPEVELCCAAAEFNESAHSVRAIVVNQFGFTKETIGASAPEGLCLQDLRRAADAEFGLSTYEPFGISPVEPIHAGAVAVVTAISGCAGFMHRAAGDLGIDPAAHPCFLVGEFVYPDVAATDFDAAALKKVENVECARIAKALATKLPRTTAERAACLEAGQKLAHEMSWDRVCQREFLPALRELFTPAAV